MQRVNALRTRLREDDDIMPIDNPSTSRNSSRLILVVATMAAVAMVAIQFMRTKMLLKGLTHEHSADPFFQLLN